MLKDIPHINPAAITDIDELQNLLKFFMNLLENQASRIEKLCSENQALRDELNRLKGEQGKPDISGKNQNEGTENTGDISSEKERKKRKKRKKRRVKFDSTRRIDVTNKVDIEDKSNLPPDIIFKG